MLRENLCLEEAGEGNRREVRREGVIKFRRGIRFKIVTFICLVGLILIIAGVVLGYFRGFILLRNTIVFEHKEIAGRISAAISEIIDKEVNVLETHAASHFWKSAVIEKNQEYSARQKEAVQKLLLDTDKQWAQAKENSRLIKEYLNTPLSLRLKKLVEVDKDIKEIFVTDNCGGLVAASGKTSDFYQADETWWQEVFYQDDVFIGDIEFDESSKAWSLPIAVPVKDDQGKFIGICKAVLGLDSFFLPLARVKIGKSGRAFMVDDKGYFLFHEGIVPLSQRFANKAEFQKLITSKGQWGVVEKIHLKDKEKRLTAVARLSNAYLLKEGKKWWVFVAQDVNEAFAALTALFKQMFILLAILLILLVFLGYVFGGIFVKPIKELNEIVRHVAKGKLDYPLEIKTGDEIEEFANAFKEMVSQVKQKQSEILQQKAYADAIISSMVDTLIVVDPDGLLKRVNRAILDLLNYKEEELIGQPVEKIFAEEVLFEGKRLEKLIREGTVRNFDLTYVTKSGEKIPVSFSGSVMYAATADGAELKTQITQKSSVKSAVTGVVGVARDMRQTLSFIADLEKSKEELEEFSRILEKKVEERTKTLEESQEAALNIMEDIQESKEELEKKTVALEKAKAEIERFSKGLEEKVKARTMELSILYDVSNAISYTLDHQTLLRLIMESLFKIVDYDICASLLFDAYTANITLKPAYPGSAGFVDKVKNNLINSTAMLTGENIRRKQINALLIPISPDAQLKEKRKFDELRSFFNVPFVVRGKTIGMINISSCKDSAFSENDVKLIYAIASQASNAIERLQAVITAEKSKMESMVESMAEGVIMIDERGEVAVLNPQARRMLGFELTDNITRKALEEKIKTVALDRALQECQDKKCLITREIALPGEKNIVLRCDITPVKDTEGEIIGIVTILRDVTKEKEVDKMKTEFIATVSHELRTPLTSIREVVSQVLEGILGPTTEVQKEFLAICLEDVERLKRIINNLLDISKIEAGKVEIKRERVDIAALAERVNASFITSAQDKGIELRKQFPAEPLYVYVDKDKIIQVFTNLIGNAYKFTEKGYIEISIIDKKAEVECRISDTGKGIAREDLPKVFSRFQQFGRVDGPGEKGTGLGLSIAKGIIELHAGKIWVESELSKGTKISFTLAKHNAAQTSEEFINNSIEQAQRNNLKMSVIRVSIDQIDGLKQQLPEQETAFVLRDIERVIQYSLRKINDAVVMFGEEFFVVVHDCDKANAVKVKNRLQQAVEVYLVVQKNLSDKIKLRFGCATYPDDNARAEGLIKTAAAESATADDAE
ncbi:MAG: ATP-binding protein [Candidatus Omnitrophota bacterium]